MPSLPPHELPQSVPPGQVSDKAGEQTARTYNKDYQTLLQPDGSVKIPPVSAEHKAVFGDELVFPNELRFQTYSIVAYNPAAIPGDCHPKLLALTKPRSSHWEPLRNAVVKDHPFCAFCGYTFHLNVHHIRPFHLHPELELERNNLIVLGEACPSGNHHYLIGHFLNWHKFNPAVVLDATRFLGAISKAI